MKKYILKTAFFALFVSTLVSCEEDTVTYGGGNFVTFDQVATTRLIALEDGGDSATAINLAFPLSTDLVIKVEVKSDVAVDGVDYTIPSTSITIPAGQTSGNFVIHAIDNTIANDSKIVEVRLIETNNASVAVGINDIGSPYKRLVLLNDDCPTRFVDLLGKFEVFDGDEYIGDAQVDINDNGDCDILRISGTVENIVGLETDTYVEIQLMPGSGATAKTRGTISSYQQLLCGECYNNSTTGNVESWLITPTGNFNTVTQVITLNGTMETASGYYTGISSSVQLKRPASN